MLQNCKIQPLRQMSMEALLCVIIEVFTYRKEKRIAERKKSSEGEQDFEEDETAMEDVDNDENWSGNIW